MIKTMKDDVSSIIKKLDLDNFISSFMSYYAREKSKIDISLKSERINLFSLMCDFEKLHITPPPRVKILDNEIAKLKKFGTLDIDDIYEFIKIIRYFMYLKNGVNDELHHLNSYLDKIVIPQDLIHISDIFLTQKELDKSSDAFKLKKGIYAELDAILSALSYIENDIKTTFMRLLNQNNLTPYFVDRQMHFIHDTQALLLKPGFQHTLKGNIIARSSSGFFYVVPESISKITEKKGALKNRLEIELLNICKDLSAKLQKHILFLNFIDREFDKIDSILARINFAKDKNLNFAFNPKHQKNNEIILHEFSHPNLLNPKPLSVEMTKNILMITGVNAGGKTILLKSILSAVFLNKFLLPMKINSTKSKIPDFKSIQAIISDPQNSKNDISTFAGRMLGFSEILESKNMLLGIDEIELGTDADEASALYKSLLEHIIQNNCMIIVTTHHKRLAQLMAKNHNVEMLAAIFDEHKMLPTYTFLKGSVGKSYAFETAIRYHIPKNIINDARQNYGKDKEKLNYLIENSTKLEIELKEKINNIDLEMQKIHAQQLDLESTKEKLKNKNDKYIYELETIYKNAMKELQNVAKNTSKEDIHKSINKANKILATKEKLWNQTSKNLSKNIVIQKGDNIKYNQQVGIVESITNKMAFVLLDNGIKIKTNIDNLEKLNYKPVTPKVKINYQVKSANISLDLHGKRVEEALELVSKFIDDALLAGFDSVLIYHGIGTGRLSLTVKEYLDRHPKILRYEDAPQNMGGFGAKMVYL